ncbi:replication factor C large subunit [Methanolobus sp. ZRKC3]|uniref:replication factor C large subunit n=1 Tax=Methanolobus sp. ZRKC3 TaxID=3125786 RepID=UPI003249DF57
MTVQMEWAEKYRPRLLADVIGHKKPVDDLRSWADQWVHGVPDKKAALLHGQAGIGKTSCAHALAADFGWEVIELNASDQRTASVIEKVAGSASQTRTLTGTSGRRLVILDEADNLHGNSDRGGSRALINIIKKTSQPIVLIANDLYGISSSLRSLCLELKFGTVQTRSMIPALKKIAQNEGVMCGVGVIEKLAEGAGGDFRSAVNDLQAVAMGRTEINIEDISTSERDTKESIFKAIGKVFKGSDIRSVQDSIYSLDESPEDIVHWIDENLPYQYTGKGEEKLTSDIAQAYTYLSRADRFLGRVRRRQNYRMWRYASALMVGGTVVSRSRMRGGYVKYQAPSLWRKMGQMRSRRNMRDNIASKIGSHCHESMSYSRLGLASIYSQMLEDGSYAPGVVANLGLDQDELVHMSGSSKLTKKLQAIYDEAQNMRKDRPDGDVEFFVVPPTRESVKAPSQMSLDKISESIPKSTTVKKDSDNSDNSKDSDNSGSSARAKSSSQRKPQKTLFDF